MKKRSKIILAVLISLPVAFIAVQALRIRKPGIISGCPHWALSEAKHATEVIHPEAIVIEPWQGRHNVFATFKVPKGYKHSSVFMVTLKDSSPYCGYVKPRSHAGKEKQVLGLFRTRTALWLMTKGQMTQLEQPSNWKLVIFKDS